MRLFSDAVEYGLRATVWLAARPPKAYKVREISEGTAAPAGYLVKVLQALTKAGILSAQRGQHGGFALLRDPAELTALEVVDAIDRLEGIPRCPLGRKEHEHELCPLHRALDQAVANTRAAFEGTTIAQLVDQPDRPPLCEPEPVAGRAGGSS